MQENAPLQAFNSFGLKVQARYFCSATSGAQLQQALDFVRERGLPLLVIGGGSNLLLREDFPGLVLQPALRGIRYEEEDEDWMLVRAASGENWHEFVSFCLEHGLHGLENLALIPGTVGAAPIQNIGAYGVEVGEFIESVEVLDIATGNSELIDKAHCLFAYRDSVFKHALRGRKIVLAVHFRLRRQPRLNLSYAALATELAGKQASPRALFAAVCAIRRAKLPDPATLGNAGSFFKNPVIKQQQYRQLQAQHPTIPGYLVPEDAQYIKLPAAWLIEQTGWKAKALGGAAVYEKQALVIVNRGEATAQEIVALARAIIDAVWQAFAVRLEPEVQWVPPYTETEIALSGPQ